jgi:hypothetical protein
MLSLETKSFEYSSFTAARWRGRSTFNTGHIRRLSARPSRAPLSFTVPGQAAVAGGYVGSGFDLRINTVTNIFAAFEGTIYSDKSRSGTARGGVRVRF